MPPENDRLKSVHSLLILLLRKVDGFIQALLSRSWPRGFYFFCQERIEFRRTIARYAQRLPIARLEVFGEIDDLSDVIRVMRNLTVDGLHHRVVLAANLNGSHELLRRQRLNRFEDALPAFVPECDHLRLRGIW